MQKYLIIFICLILSTNLKAQKVYKLYFLGGQSNMDGLGKVAELQDNFGESISDIKIFHGNTSADNEKADGKGIWADLKPGHGFGFYSDGKKNFYSELFGPELGFGAKLKELEPGSNIAIIKYSRSGSSIDTAASRGFGCWHPDYEGINQFGHFKETVKNAYASSDIDNDGENVILIPSGIIWMQGESDGDCTEKIALRYEDNLKYLISQIREVFQNSKLPVVIGKVSDSGNRDNGKAWEFGEIVMAAQKAFVESDSNAAIVTETDSLGYTDFAHYNSEGFLKLGNLFAEKIHYLNKIK